MYLWFIFCECGIVLRKNSVKMGIEILKVCSNRIWSNVFEILKLIVKRIVKIMCKSVESRIESKVVDDGVNW